jgi:hypothetical protein
MVSYNNVAKLTYFSENDRKKNFLDLFLSLCNSNNIIEILSFIKEERFVEKDSSIKIVYDGKEAIIFKENFLLNIPKSNPTNHTIDDFEFVLDYPDIIDYTCKPMHCIKSIKYQDEIHHMKANTDYNLITKPLYNQLRPKINEYISELHNISIYEIGPIVSGFTLHIDLIIKIIELAFVTSFKHIIDERLFLMKEYNFTYEAFDQLSYLEAKQYLIKGIKLINERNNSEAK